MENKNVAQGLFFGGFASCVAEICTLPIDVTKTRMQLQGEGGGARQYKTVFDAVPKIMRTEGPAALFKGVKPALLRQATYGSMRYGFYTPIKNALGMRPGEDCLWKKILSGALSGAVSSGLANPTDLIKVRMQVDGMRAGQHAYNGLIDAGVSIIRHEGVLGLWKGVIPTCSRATVLAAAELASYDEIKTRLRRSGYFNDGLALHVGSALSAGFIGTFFSNPFDVTKSRLMSQPFDAAGKGTRYSGMLDCFVQSAQKEGPFSLQKGFFPNYCRVGPRVLIIFVVMEQMRSFVNSSPT